jgi:hypothetical protein
VDRKNSNKNILVILEVIIVLFLFIMAFQYQYYARLHPEYFIYTENQLLDVDKPYLKPCDYNYICKEEWVTGREPYIKTVAPTLYWVISNNGKLTLFLLAYFIVTQHKNIFSLWKRIKRHL